VSALDRRLDPSPEALERVAFAGLQDSMPRAALLSIHARVEGTHPGTWSEAPLVQLWGPRYSAYVIAERDLAVFALGRLPDDAKGRHRAEDIADRLESAIGDERVDVREAARIVGVHHNALRYAAPTGRFLIYWDGAKRPLIWAVPAPSIDPREARVELARRYLHVFGPGTPDSFALWAGVQPKAARGAFDDLDGELIQVQTPIGNASILATDEAAFRSADGATATRLLPSGDTYFLAQGRDRELQVPEVSDRNRLWTPRVWPGAVLHNGEIVGTWRRSEHRLTIDLWRPVEGSGREEIEGEATALPLPGLERPITVTWEGVGV
jgi:hypothetical protein